MNDPRFFEGVVCDRLPERFDRLKHKAKEGYEVASAEGQQLAGQVKHDLERDHGQPASRPH